MLPHFPISFHANDEFVLLYAIFPIEICFFFLNHFNEVRPHIHPFAFDEEANSGDSVQLTCHASKGDLPLSIKWLFNHQPMFSHLSVLTNKIGDRISLLTIPSVQAKNSGEYTCVAENAGGKANYSTRLNVNGSK